MQGQSLCNLLDSSIVLRSLLPFSSFYYVRVGKDLGSPEVQPFLVTEGKTQAQRGGATYSRPHNELKAKLQLEARYPDHPSQMSFSLLQGGSSSLKYVVLYLTKNVQNN